MICVDVSLCQSDSWTKSASSLTILRTTVIDKAPLSKCFRPGELNKQPGRRKLTQQPKQHFFCLHTSAELHLQPKH